MGALRGSPLHEPGIRLIATSGRCCNSGSLQSMATWLQTSIPPLPTAMSSPKLMVFYNRQYRLDLAILSRLCWSTRVEYILADLFWVDTSVAAAALVVVPEAWQVAFDLT